MRQHILLQRSSKTFLEELLVWINMSDMTVVTTENTEFDCQKCRQNFPAHYKRMKDQQCKVLTELKYNM